MAEATLMGWDNDAGVWRKILVNSEGKLIIDPSEIFEDPPTEDEMGKAPASKWAYDHAADAAAHHAKYTDAEARAAINNILDSTGRLTGNLNCNFKSFNYVDAITLRRTSSDSKYVVFYHNADTNNLRMYVTEVGVGSQHIYLQLYNGSSYDTVCTEPVTDSKIATHAAIVDAHHTRYTDAEAKAAVGFNGTKYWSAPGCAFDAHKPDTDNVVKPSTGRITIGSTSTYLTKSVHLPHGAVITDACVYGNSAARTKYWFLWRLRLSDAATVQMAMNQIHSADSSINYATVDNSAYAYFFATDSLATADEIWGARIEYTI
jgi:hypothetical protein